MTGGTRPPGLRLAVIGDPVAHSLSPTLQRGFLAAANVPGTYEAIRVPAGQGAAAVGRLRAQGYHGLNVTTPLKEEAFAVAELRDEISLASAAVNTLVLGERIEGYNTDGIGALGALHEAGLEDPRERRVLILGAGPTARAVAAALVGAGARVSVWNRTAARAQALGRALGARVFRPGDLFEAVFSTLAPGAEPDAAGLRRALLEAPIVVDANYADRATLGASLGRATCDGRSMLAHSAAASFELWRSAFLGDP